MIKCPGNILQDLQVLSHQINLNTFLTTELTPDTFSDRKSVQLENQQQRDKRKISKRLEMKQHTSR